MVMYNFCQLIADHAEVKPPENGRKYKYKINFTMAVHICRGFLKKEIKENDVIRQIEKYILPIRNGRNNQTKGIICIVLAGIGFSLMTFLCASRGIFPPCRRHFSAMPSR